MEPRKCLVIECPKYPEYEGKKGVVVDEKISRFNTKIGYKDETVYAVEVDGVRIPGWATKEDIRFVG